MQLGPFWVGDDPANPLEIELVDLDGEDSELDQYTTATATLAGPGGSVDIGGVAIADDVLSFTLPDDPFPEAGLYQVRIVLAASGTKKLRVDPVWIVVQGDDGWATLSLARDPEAAEWREAETIGDVKLWRLLEVARDQVIAYAPVLNEGQLVPTRYLDAQLMQARNIWNAGRVSPSGEAGGDSFAITPFPLDWQVKQILRPKTGVPVIA